MNEPIIAFTWCVMKEPIIAFTSFVVKEPIIAFTWCVMIEPFNSFQIEIGFFLIQSGTKPNLAAKNWLPNLVTISHRLPKLVANISSKFSKWRPIKVANTSKIEKFEWFIASWLEMAPSDCNHF